MVERKRNEFGYNEHFVDIPSFVSYMFNQMTNPFYIIQYVFCGAYFYTDYKDFGIILLIFITITTIINYVLLYRSYRKIKDIAEREINVEVIRGRKIVTINSNELVPGDVYIPDKEVVCDALVLQGDAFVSEANLTGESDPVGKFVMSSFDSIYQS